MGIYKTLFFEFPMEGRKVGIYKTLFLNSLWKEGRWGYIKLFFFEFHLEGRNVVV